MAQILDGRLVSNSILEKVKKEIDQIPSANLKPKLAIILVGDNPASLSYIKQKEKAAKETGLEYEQINYSTNVTQDELIKKIHQLNDDPATHGILIQLPLPEHLDVPKILKEINPRKDVDGFHAYNLGKMFLSKEFETLAPCTPKGIIEILEFYNLDIKGKDVTVIGHSNIVGKPMSIMLLNRDATVTTCHVHTKDLKSHTQNADIVVSATGVPGLLKADMVKPDSIIIDVGCTKVDGKLKGDADFEALESKVKAITPVPGGVGPMTVACLIENVLLAYNWLQQNPQTKQ